MQFAIIARDGTDPGALARRLAVRERHISVGDEMVAMGHALFGAALLDDHRMVGSIQVMEFPTREDLDAYLATEPYVTGGVWRDIQVIQVKVGPSYTAGRD